MDDLDLKELSRVPTYLDALETDLREEINRTHGEITTHTGEVHVPRDGWDFQFSEQFRRDAWRRSGRRSKSKAEFREEKRE